MFFTRHGLAGAFDWKLGEPAKPGEVKQSTYKALVC